MEDCQVNVYYNTKNKRERDKEVQATLTKFVNVAKSCLWKVICDLFILILAFKSSVPTHSNLHTHTKK